jgi:hypothetical protein
LTATQRSLRARRTCISERMALELTLVAVDEHRKALKYKKFIGLELQVAITPILYIQPFELSASCILTHHLVPRRTRSTSIRTCNSM